MQETMALAGVLIAVLFGTGIAFAFRVAQLQRRAPAIDENPVPPGRLATVVGTFGPGGGQVEIDGTRWSAIALASRHEIAQGTPVRVLGFEAGYTLMVEPILVAPPAQVTPIGRSRRPHPQSRAA